MATARRVELDPRARRWFRANTRSAGEWSVADLVAAKRDAVVSVVIPARDEERTIASIVGPIVSELVRRTGLVDEVIVMDSQSADSTASVAVSAGATVHAVGDVRPDLGTGPGKGEAVWKSQFVSRGDILVFLDGDLTNWGLHFITGLLGPLLTQPEVLLCKGFYDRILADDADSSGRGRLRPQGGRVTELVARPLLNIRWPELSAVVQPLGGEWAMRRDQLAALAIPVGYGVEFATLVDTWRVHGLRSIAQVDLGDREHRHQAVHDLGVMAAEIIQVADRRCGLAGHTRTLHQFDRQAAGSWVARPVPSTERPPVAGLNRDA